MNFTPIDLQKWPRGQMFYYFSKMAPTSYSLTALVDVTGLKAKLKENGLKFFPVYLWLVTRCLNQQQEFKIAYKDGILGYYDTLTPLYASFHEENKTFSFMWTPFDNDLSVFHKNYCENQKNYGGNMGVLSQPATPPPENAYTVSCIPWISFQHFAVHSHENKPYFFPSVEAGRIYTSYEKTYRKERLPLSITCHHAVTDGYHVDRFLKDLEMEIEKLRMEL